MQEEGEGSIGRGQGREQGGLGKGKKCWERGESGTAEGSRKGRRALTERKVKKGEGIVN